MRKILHPDDYGDDDTIGVCLKVKWKSFHEMNNQDFGIYLGNCRVGVRNLQNEIIRTIQYQSEEEMKKVWTLD